MSRARNLADYVSSGVTAAEFDYMDGVTSNVQTQMDAKSPTTGHASIATVGTVTSGTWQGTTVAVNQGGTGAATHTANNVMIGAGTSALTSIAPGADGQVLTSTGSVWQSEAVSAGGITHASQWQVTASFDGDEDPISDDMAENVNQGHGVLGASMTIASGIFTFPVTGIWLINFKWSGYASSSAAAINPYIVTIVDGNGVNVSQAQIAINVATPNYYGNAFTDFIFDVADTTTHFCKFGIGGAGSNVHTNGSASYNRTSFTFIRLGDSNA